MHNVYENPTSSRNKYSPKAVTKENLIKKSTVVLYSPSKKGIDYTKRNH